MRCGLTVARATMIFVCLAAGAQAQTAGGPEPEPLEENENFVAREITIFGTRTKRKVLDVPANITVIPGVTIEKENVSNIKELIRYEPGIDVTFQSSGTDPFNTFGGFTIRGVGGNRVQMLVDGARVPERIIDGTRDFIDLDFTKQVDIVRGPGSVLWGSDALGGIVAVETLDPEDLLVGGKYIGGFGSVDYDSFDNGVDTSLIVALQVTPKIAVLGGISYDHANEGKLSKARADGGIYGCPRNLTFGATPCNELDPTTTSSVRGLAKVVFTPNEDHRFEVTADVMNRETDVDYNQVLGPVRNFFGTPTGDVITAYDRELVIKRHRFALEHEWEARMDWLDRVNWTLSYAPQSSDHSGNEYVTEAGGDRVLNQDFLSFSEDFLEFDIQATSSFAFAGTEHTLTYGFDGDYTRTNYERIDRVINLTTGATSESRAGGFNFANATTVRADFFIQDEIKMFDGALEFIPGIRVAHYTIDPKPNADYQPVPGKEPRKVSNTSLVAKVGALYHFDENFSAYGQFGQGFKMPTAQQLYTSLPGAFFSLIPAPDLKPESVNSFELGFRGQFDKGYFSINGFFADYDEFIQSFYNVPGTNDYTYRNLTDVKIWGIEASAEFEPADNWRTSFTFAWQRGITVASPGADTRVFDVPPFQLVARVGYEIPEYGLDFLVASVFAAGPGDRVSSPDLYVPSGYAVFDAYATWEFYDNVALNFGILNIFDQRYFNWPMPYTYNTNVTDSVARSNPIELQTAPGRTFRVGLNIAF